MSAAPAVMIQHPHAEIRHTGIRIPPVIFGISALGNLYQSMTPERKQDIVAACHRHTASPVVFDGAGKYGAGMALEALGVALRQLGVGADDVVISNKLGWRRTQMTGTEPTFEPGVWKDLTHDAVMDISGEGILRCYAEGLALLGGPYRTDLVSIHDPDEYLASAGNDADLRSKRLQDIRDAYRELIRLRQQGVVKAVGIGSKDWRVIREIVDDVDVDWVMLACSLTVMSHPRELLNWVAETAKRGVAIIDSALFHGGFLTGSDHLDYRPVDAANPKHAAALRWRANYMSICHRHAVLPAVAAVGFALRIPGVVSVALNSTRTERVSDNIAMASARIPTALWQDLRTARLIDPDLEFLS